MNPIEKILGIKIKKKQDISKDSRQKLHFDEVNGKRVSFYHPWNINFPFTLRQWQVQVNRVITRASSFEEGVNALLRYRVNGYGIYSDYATQIGNEGYERLKQKFGVKNNSRLTFQNYIQG